MVFLSACPACSGAGGEGLDEHTGSWGARGWGHGGGLAGGHREKKIKKLDGRLELGSPVRDVDGGQSSRPALEVTPGSKSSAGGGLMGLCSVPVFLVQLAQKLKAVRQPESYFWIYFHLQWKGIWWSWYWTSFLLETRVCQSENLTFSHKESRAFQQGSG